ncbi:L-arginine-binding protein-like [Ptychodera flava]|uniref:L-arginine-binding protein-like n=1 Tax=Ptychodera flava TaxID=63121 RepID=UPI00396A711D
MAVTGGITHSVAFTDKWLHYTGPARFFVPVGNPDNFDPNDITGKRIGFIKGWDSNLHCLKHNDVTGSKSFLPDQVVPITSPSDLPYSLERKEIDAAFVFLWTKHGVDDNQAEMIGGMPAGLEPIGEVLYCLDGLGLGTRKDSPVIGWFNAALRRLKTSGKYAALCRNAQKRHGPWGQIDCIF